MRMRSSKHILTEVKSLNAYQLVMNIGLIQKMAKLLSWTVKT